MKLKFHRLFNATIIYTKIVKQLDIDEFDLCTCTWVRQAWFSHFAREFFFWEKKVDIFGRSISLYSSENLIVNRGYLFVLSGYGIQFLYFHDREAVIYSISSQTNFLFILCYVMIKQIKFSFDNMVDACIFEISCSE